MEVSFIQRQLDMGEPIEHDHTQDHKLAKDIALQHLDEIPDYYTRLKKMEADAKKHHKKFKDVKEENSSDGNLQYDWNYPIQSENTRYCPKCKKDETKEECRYGEKYWLLFSMPSKLKEGNLHKWYQDSESVDKKPGWVEVISGEPCAREEGEEGTPKCVSSDKRASMTKKERISAQRRKSAADPNQPEKSGAAKPTYVSTDNPEKKMNEEKDIKGKGSGKKDACYHKVKSRYDVWPSAYASGALVKCRKVGAANWGTKSEETMHEEERFCPLCDKRETRSQCSYGEKAWDKVSVKDEEYSMARSELKTIEDAVKRLKAKVGNGEGDLEAWVQSKITKAADYIDTAADYVTSGEMEESLKVRKGILKGKEYQIARSTGAGALSPEAATELGSKAIELRKKKLTQTELPKIKKEKTLVDKLTNEILDEKCWIGYKRKKNTAAYEKDSCVKAEDVTIEDAEGNTFAEVVDLIQPEPIKGFKSQVNEATRLQAQTGNIIGVTLSWRAKYYSMKMFFPQVKLPTRKEINDELQKVYPGSVVIHHSVSELQPGQPLIQACVPHGGSTAKFGSNKNYIKTMGEEIELEEEGPSLSVGRGEKLPVSRGGGLTTKGREKYNRETGSNLQAPVTGDVKPGSKAAKRRKNFCSRSRSWKEERGLAARRRWKC